MLYEEALADSKKLKQVAEQNAKNAIVEAVAPKIKQLIETQLLSDGDGDDESDLLENVAEEFSREEDGEEKTQVKENNEYVLTDESIKFLSDLLKEENLLEKFELKMYRLHSGLQKTLLENSNNKIERLINTKKTLKEFKDEINSSKNKLDETSFKKLNTNIDFMLNSTLKFIHSDLNEKTIRENFSKLSKKIDNLDKNKKISNDKKNAYAKKIFKEARTICDHVNNSEIRVSSESKSEIEKTLKEISNKLRGYKNETKKKESKS